MRRVLLSCTVGLLLAVSAQAADVAVIAHPTVPVETVSRAELLDMYTGDIREWDNGEPIALFDLKLKNEVRASFYLFLGKSSSRMKSIWMKNMLSGEGRPPETAETEEELLNRVASTPGSIGYVRAALPNESVRTLAVIRDPER